MTHLCSIVPPYLLRHLVANAAEPVAESARATLALDQVVRQVRDVRQSGSGRGGVTGGVGRRTARTTPHRTGPPCSRPDA